MEGIFCIDDDLVTLMICKRIIEKSGVTNIIHNATNGLEGLETLETLFQNKQLPKLILLDLNMPVLNGWDFLNVIENEESYQKIHVVILSSTVDPADFEKTKNYKMVKGFISKPLTVENLLDIYKSF
ncbi:MAG: response regulator [Flavobacterium sp.]